MDREWQNTILTINNYPVVLVSIVFCTWVSMLIGHPRRLSGKESSCQCRRCKRCRFYPGIRKILWKRAWQPTPVFLPGESHGQRSLAGYSPLGHKESDLTEWAHVHVNTYSVSWWFKLFLWFLSVFFFSPAKKLSLCKTAYHAESISLTLLHQ